MGHHHHAPATAEEDPFGSKRYLAAAAMQVAFVALEVTVGIWLFSSTGLIADAGHNAGDFITGLFAAIAARLVSKRGHTHIGHWSGIFVCAGTVILIATAVGLESTTPPNNSASTVIVTSLLAAASFGVNRGIARYLKHSSDPLAQGMWRHYYTDAKVSLWLIPFAILALVWSWFMLIGAIVIIAETIKDNWAEARSIYTKLRDCQDPRHVQPQRSI